MNNPKLPTIFHITHQKAGSQWVAEILKYSALQRFITSQTLERHFRETPVRTGMIYPTLYVNKQDFDRIMAAGSPLVWRTYSYGLKHPKVWWLNWFHFRVQRRPYRIFVVIRDLRDTLVSAYYSLKISHQLLTPQFIKWRETLQQLHKENGFLYLMDEYLYDHAAIQVSWLTADALIVKYEDLLNNEHAVFEQIIEHCQIEVDLNHLYDIVANNSFEAVTGRKRGQEDVTAHLRKGIVGDWRNHFNERVKEEFKKRFGHVLIQIGYEQNLNW